MSNLIKLSQEIDKMHLLFHNSVSIGLLHDFLKRYELLTVVVGLLFLLLTSGMVIRTVFTMAGITPPINGDDRESAREDMLYGRIFGKSENIIIFLLVLFNGYTALALIFTGKTIVRNRDKEKISVYHLAGTMINTAYSIMIAALIKYIIGKSGPLV